MQTTRDKSIKVLLEDVQYVTAKKLGHCLVGYMKDNVSYVRYHATDIVICNGSQLILNTNGFKTVTTKKHINASLQGYNISKFIVQKGGVWYLDDHVFYDGMVLDMQGNVLDERDDEELARTKRYEKLIKKYIVKMREMHSVEGKFPEPSNGDCWFCMTEAKDFGDHVLAHLEETYVHGSLIVRALINAGYTDFQLPVVYHMAHITLRAVRKYLKKSVNLPC